MHRFSLCFFGENNTYATFRTDIGGVIFEKMIKWKNFLCLLNFRELSFLF